MPSTAVRFKRAVMDLLLDGSKLTAQVASALPSRKRCLEMRRLRLQAPAVRMSGSWVQALGAASGRGSCSHSCKARPARRR
eukprot:CAMPEP_0195086064 /NCGR_PEP_ID=MMETSP0448-20130528/26305_1 /TAXON_ID=66468 /ORGANISM="Heterocapsa triquestra, Strain CCMP 448" /LENGTH=80 /DNA_ID=CAMNT_0040119497 /DNA_START=37 /DNA_END=276 /DNA_ORIENTATION=-